MMQIRRFLYMTIVLTAVLFLCTGCSEERKEKQLTLRQQGITYLENGQYEEALEKFQSALDESLGNIGKTELDICYYKAEAQYLSGDSEGAVKTYTAIIDYNNDPRAYFLRGNLYYSMNDEAAALKDYDSAVKYEKKDYELYIGIYEAMAAHEKKTEGLEYLNKALEIKGDSAYDKMQKGWLNFLLGKNQDAIDLLQKAVEGKEHEANYCLVEVYLAMGDMASAQTYMKAYIDSGVADSYKLYSVAESQLSKGNYDMATGCLEEALKLEMVPNKQIVMKTLAISYERANNFVAARKVLTDYVKLYPEDEEAARELTFLETR